MHIRSLEGGYRFVSPWTGVGITPMPAGQFTTFDLPAYAEQPSPAPTILRWLWRQSVTDPRSELGFPRRQIMAVQDGVLTLPAVCAWAMIYTPVVRSAPRSRSLPVHRCRQRRGAGADTALTTGPRQIDGQCVSVYRRVRGRVW